MTTLSIHFTQCYTAVGAVHREKRKYRICLDIQRLPADTSLRSLQGSFFHVKNQGDINILFRLATVNPFLIGFILDVLFRILIVCVDNANFKFTRCMLFGTFFGILNLVIYFNLPLMCP